MACEEIETALRGLEQEKDLLQEDLHEATPSGKAAITAQIKRLNADIRTKREELRRCLSANGLTHTVTIQLATQFIQQSYFAGLRAERHELFQGDFHRQDTQTITQPAGQATVVFQNIRPGKHRFCVLDTSSRPAWRSSVLDIDRDETFSFVIMAAPFDDTTLDDDELQDEIELPIEQDIEGLEETMSINSVDIAVLSNSIDIDGEGSISKGNERTLLESDFTFDYRFNLKPTKSINHRRFVKVQPVEPMTLEWSNVITGIGAWFVQEQINQELRDTIRRRIDRAVRQQVSTVTRNRFGDRPETSLVTATIRGIQIIEDGTEEVTIMSGQTVTIPNHKLRMFVEISIPSALLQGNFGCSSAAAIGVAVMALLVLTACVVLL